MATLESVKAKIQGLIEKANIVTSRADTQLTPAVDALIEGYGSGGGGFVDVTELPNISEAEADVVYRLLQRVEASVGIYVAVYDGAQTTVMSLDDMFAAEGAAINTKIYVVAELPEVMEMIDEATLTIPFYVIESTGIAYLSLDGTNVAVATAGEMFESPDGNGGWIESTENIPQDKLQLGMNFFCMRSEASIVVKGLYIAANGEWQFFNEIINVDQLPASNINPNALYRMGKKLDRDLYTTVGGSLKKFLEYLEPFNSTIKRIEFVDVLPEQFDDTTIFVLNKTGIMYYFNDGVLTDVNSVPLFVLWFGRSLGWVDADNITENVQGIYTCTGEGFFSNEYHKYIQGTWETFSAKPMFIEYLSGTITELTDSDLKGATKIGNGSFSDYTALKRVEIPSNIASLGQRAFANCYNLEEVVFNSSSCAIGLEAFMGCTALKNINLGDLYDISEIHSRAFKGCTSLTSVVIAPGSPYFWDWGDAVFEDCTSLESAILNFQNSDGDINPIGTFRGCTSLKDVVLPADWVYNLPDETFYGCTSLKEIELGGDVGQYALAYSGITDITFRGTKAQWASAPNGGKWDYKTPDYVIHCTDGDILKSDPESGSDDTPDEPESSGMELNIAYGDTPPEDTTKLWVKTSEPSKVIISAFNSEGTLTTYDDKIVNLGSVTTNYQHCANACAKVGSYVYSFGGFRYSNATNGVRSNFILKIEAKSVTQLNATLPSSDAYLSCAAVGTKIYLFGGENTSATIYCFDTTTETITTLSTKLSMASQYMGCASVGTKIYLLGGYGTQTNIFCFDTETETITTLSVQLPKQWYRGGCVAIGTDIYLLGGFNQTDAALNDIYCFNTETQTITEKTAKLGTARFASGCVAIGEKIIIYGGASEYIAGTTSSVTGADIIEIYDTVNDTIRASAKTPLLGCRIYPACAPHPSDTNSLLVVGGASNFSKYYNSFSISFLGYLAAFTPAQDIAVDADALFIQCYNPDVNKMWRAMQSGALDLIVSPYTAHKGDANGVGQVAQMALYKNDTWTTI